MTLFTQTSFLKRKQDTLLFLEGLKKLAELPKDLYIQKFKNFSSVGADVRHCIEHYRAILDGWETGKIDLSGKERDREFEENPFYAKQYLGHLIKAVGMTPENSADRNFFVTESSEPSGEKQTTEQDLL